MRCKICGFECLEEGEMSLHAFEEHDLQLEDIVEETTAEEEALSIDDSPETSVVEESGVPAYVVEPENETEKKERLHWALGGKIQMLSWNTIVESLTK